MEGITEQGMIQRGMRELRVPAYTILQPREQIVLDATVRFINDTRFPIGVATVEDPCLGGRKAVIISASRQDDFVRRFDVNAAVVENLRICQAVNARIDNPEFYYGWIANELQGQVQMDRPRALYFAAQMFSVDVLIG